LDQIPGGMPLSHEVSVTLPRFGGLTFLAFGTFDGLSGDRTVATVTLDTLAESFGATTIDLIATNAFADEAGSPLPVALVGTSVRVVPEPGAVGLLGTALGVVGLAVRRHAKR